jgi:hypothetical protein
MRKTLTLTLSLVLAACDGTDPDPRPTDPPPPWGAPISGGTMAVSRDGRLAVIADPDRDRVVTVDLASGAVGVELALTAGDEPGRLVEDGAGRFHVALRRGGSIVTFDPVAGAVIARRPACAEPRGLVWSPTDDLIHVACTSGELVTFAAAGGDATRRLQLDRDLRDVVISGDQLVVTRFRTAELITLDSHGSVVAQEQPPTVQRSVDPGGQRVVDATPAVAWRTIALADGRVVMIHQRQLQNALRTQEEGGYGGSGCGGAAVEDAITIQDPGGAPVAVAPVMAGALPVDVAASLDGSTLAIATAGNQAVVSFSTDIFATTDTEPCPLGVPRTVYHDDLGAPTAVAYAPDGALLVFYPEAPAMVRHPVGGLTQTIGLPGGVGYDAGRELFHSATALGLACASCHPEARDDGLVWEFAELGTRRTQSVAGGILGRAPYHWTGDQADLHALLAEVFVRRMSGTTTTDFQRRSLGPWLDRIPAPAPPVGDLAAIARGQTTFESPAVGCITCHNGPLFTNNQRFDVGTTGMFKVPSLRGVAARAPYLHDGCAPTLLDRLTTPCGGGDRHGQTSQLTAGELADLVEYLESL